MERLSMTNYLKRKCANCGCSFGSHCGTGYYSKQYNKFIPTNYCPGTEGRMDWDKGPGTVFKETAQPKGE